MRKTGFGLLVMTLVLLLCCCAAHAEVGLNIQQDSFRIGEDIDFTVTGLTDGDEYTAMLLSPDEKVIHLQYFEASGQSYTGMIRGYIPATCECAPGTYTLKLLSDRPGDQTAVTRAVNLTGTAIPAPTGIQTQPQESTWTEMKAVLTVPGVERICLQYAWFGESGDLIETERDNIYELTNGSVELSAPRRDNAIWACYVSAETDGVWTASSDILWLNERRTNETAPEATLTASANTDPDRFTVTAPGWTGQGVLILISMDRYDRLFSWPLTFEGGIATMTERPPLLASYRAYAVLFEDGTRVACTNVADVTYTTGTAAQEIVYSELDADVSGSFLAGADMSFNMASECDSYKVGIYDGEENQIAIIKGTGSTLPIPGWTVSTPGRYYLRCDADGYAGRQFALNIAENSKQPGAVTIGGTEGQYLKIECGPAETPQILLYREIKQKTEEWNPGNISAAEGYANTTNKLLISNLTSGEYEIRACMRVNGIYGPWGSDSFLYGMPEDKNIAITLDPDPIVFGTDYTVTGTTEAAGLFSFIVKDRENGDVLYADYNRTKVFEMDGSLLAPGDYIFRIAGPLDYAGEKEVTVTGSAPATPELSADKTYLNAPGTITFTVIAPEAQQVWLSNDKGQTYYSAVTDGKAKIPYPLGTVNGTARFRARSVVNGVNSLWSNEVVITADMDVSNDFEKLTVQDSYPVGEPIEVTLEGTGSFYLRILTEWGIPQLVFGPYTAGPISIDGELFPVGKWQIDVLNRKGNSIPYTEPIPFEIVGEVSQAGIEFRLNGKTVSGDSTSAGVAGPNMFTFRATGAQKFSVRDLNSKTELFFTPQNGEIRIPYELTAEHGAYLYVKAKVNGLWTAERELYITGYSSQSAMGQADLVLPSDLTTIEESAFEGADSIRTVEIAGTGNGCSILSNAFRNCPNLWAIRISAGVTEIADDAFAGCGTIFIYGTAGSKAEKYANAHDEGFVFIAEN